MEQYPTEILRAFLSQINTMLASLQPFFEIMDAVARAIDRSRPSP